MKRILIWTVLTLLLGSGIVYATSGTWLYPIPNNGTLAAGGVICAKDVSNLTNIDAVAAGQVLVSAGTTSCPAYSAAPSVTTLTTTGLATLGDVKFSTATVAAGSAGTAALGAVGGSGPASSTFYGWQAVKLADGTNAFVPTWR